jgi:NADH dehydrogenase
MGRHQAVASTVGIRWRGALAWWLARTYHLAMMPSAGRKLRLLADWNVGLLFGRDTAELGQLGHPRSLGDESLIGTSSGGTPEDEAARPAS